MSVESQIMADGTKCLSYEELETYIEKALRGKKPTILIEDIILLLMNSHPEKPIHGRTMLMKEAFLLYEEMLKGGEIETQNPRFVPYRYGPYSFLLMQTLDTLLMAQVVKVRGKTNSRKESFSLTPIGIAKARIRLSRMPSGLQSKISEARVGWDELGTDGILNYVYANYPRYKERSELKKRYKDIMWGKGRAH